jgi:arginine/serine-rich splicing factor 4/5/6
MERSTHHSLILSAGLPPDVRSDEVGKIFDGYGRITDCRVMTGLFGLLTSRKEK